MTKPNEMTFTPAALKQVLDAAIAEAVAAALGKAASVPKNTLVDGKTEASLKIDILVVKAFKRAGFGEVQPRIDVMTYNKWLASGHKVKPGERATKVKQFRLFHRSQVEAVALPSKAEQQAQADAAVAAHAATPAKPTLVQRLKGKGSNPAQPSLV
jgi:uncharacterized protein (DUF4415 family)